MPLEPGVKRTVAFVDGQNLFYAAKDAFGYEYPNFDPAKLAERVTSDLGWTLTETRFYTGVPSVENNPFWNQFWMAKLAVMGTRGVRTFSRPLRYRSRAIALPDGTVNSLLVGEEKGIDVRIALDVVRLTREDHLDVALIFSQDQDLSEAVDEVRAISIQQNRWIKAASAFPVGLTYPNRRGINGTEWVRIDRAVYDSCLDAFDYRPKPH